MSGKEGEPEFPRSLFLGRSLTSSFPEHGGEPSRGWFCLGTVYWLLPDRTNGQRTSQIGKDSGPEEEMGRGTQSPTHRKGSLEVK